MPLYGSADLSMAQAPSGSRGTSPTEGQLYYDTDDNTLYAYTGTAWKSVSVVTATGGTITYTGAYTVHSFTSDGTFEITGGSVSCDVLLIGGGGAAADTQGGGGGGGGFVSYTAESLSPGTYDVGVGAGGALGEGWLAAGEKGGDSSFTGLTTAIGGGGGAAQNDSATGTGGSAGGNSSYWGVRAGYTAGQGYDGGNGAVNGAGGGGGAGGAGASNSGNNAGAGGSGKASSITGTSVTYAGGGGGGSRYATGGSPGSGGSGGGGAGGSNGAGTQGTDGLGGGGGGGGFYIGYFNGGAGGSGIVIVKRSTNLNSGFRYD